jgi:UDP-N-acetylmuramate--alanine ligase
MSDIGETYFFCGIGGSGMLPLAVLLKKRGIDVVGSDRSYDQGKTPDKFQALQELGIILYPQDGAGMGDNVSRLVVSTAVEPSISDVKAAMDQGVPIVKRGALLAELFNAARMRIAVAGTSGKSTVTGMIGTILTEMDENPTIVNGGEIRNLRENEADKFSNIRCGRDDIFIAEMDESDGSIAHYIPRIAVLNNIALDHMSMEELERYFGDYLEKAEDCVVVNFDQPRVRSLCKARAGDNVVSYSLTDTDASLYAHDLKPAADGMAFMLTYQGDDYPVRLNVPGRHNVENALAALGAACAYGSDLAGAIDALESFKGIHRRMELIGTRGGITVYDDFGHNPDKISASLQSLKSFDGRLIVMFQPHGFGPLRLMRSELVAAFADHLGADDILIMPEVYYAGGTVDRSVTAHHLIDDIKAQEIKAHWFETRAEIAPFIQSQAREGDRVVIMGARDDTLHSFAHDVLNYFG